MNKALQYGMRACNTMMRKFAPCELPPVNKFHYHQGVFLSGMEHIYKVCGEEKYYEYIKAWVDSLVGEEGITGKFDTGSLDDMQPGILLFSLYKRTGDRKYRAALDRIMSIIKEWKCNEYGGFWHKYGRCENQMWLDSLYMGGPIQAMYSAFTGDMSYLDTAAKQAVLMREHMTDGTNHLMRHAWDASNTAMWSDPITGLAPEIWGRAQGWYVVAILDILEEMPEGHPYYERLAEIERETIAAIAKYQEPESSMWYQVVNRGNAPDNWLESSCSALFAYAMAKGAGMGILDQGYRAIAERAFEGILKHSVITDGDVLILKDICIGTGVGPYQYYIHRPTSINDLHGMGVFLLLCAELAAE